MKKAAKWILYALGILTVVIPICVTLFSSYSFSMDNIHILAGAAFAFITAGNIMSIIERRKQEKEIWLNLGLVVGLAIIFIFIVLM